MEHLKTEQDRGILETKDEAQVEDSEQFSFKVTKWLSERTAVPQTPPMPSQKVIEPPGSMGDID